MANSHSGNQFFVVAMVLVVALMFFVFLPELNVIVLGVSLAILFQPWYDWLSKHVGKRQDIAALLVVLSAIVIILVPLFIFGFELFVEAQGLYTSVSTGNGIPALNELRQVAQNLSPMLNVNIGSYIQQALGVLIGNLGPIFSQVLAVATALFLSFFAFYYFLKDGPRLSEKIIDAAPIPRDRTAEILQKLRAITSSVIRGSILVSFLYGLLLGVGFFLFGLPSAILWGGVTVVASFIPVFGVMLVAVPGIIYLLLIGNTVQAIGLFAWMFAMSIFMEEFLRPRLLGRGTNIHPLLMLLAVLGGLSLFGPIGILLGPLVLSLLVTLFEVYPTLSSPSRSRPRASAAHRKN